MYCSGGEYVDFVYKHNNINDKRVSQRQSIL